MLTGPGGAPLLDGLLTHRCQRRGLSSAQPMAKATSSTAIVRCPWGEAELHHVYHDTEWGVPSHDDRHLFEMILLEGAQAGLSWSTILKKRENYRRAFSGFDAA